MSDESRSKIGVVQREKIKSKKEMECDENKIKIQRVVN